MSSCLILCWATHKLWQELFDSHDFNLRVWKLWRISKLQILFNLPILIFDFASLIEYLLCPSCKYFKKMCQKNTNGERFRWHMYHCYSTGNRKSQPHCWLFLADTHPLKADLSSTIPSRLNNVWKINEILRHNLSRLFHLSCSLVLCRATNNTESHLFSEIFF